MINCGSAMLLRYDEREFEGYERIIMNAGDILFSQSAYEGLRAHGGFQLNCGRSKIVELKGRVVELGRGEELDGSTAYKGCHLLSTGSVWITARDASAFAEIAALSAGKLYYPAGFSVDEIPNLDVDRRVPYPPEAKLFHGDLKLSASLARGLNEGALLWVQGEIDASDEKALAALAEKKVKLYCSSALIYESDAVRYGSLFESGDFEEVPDGYEILRETLRLGLDNAVLYGAKLYVRGGLYIAKGEEESLQGIEKLIVRGEAKIPAEAVKAFREKGEADALKVYRGALWEIVGQGKINHAQLAAAKAQGKQYTLDVSGALDFDEDVQAEDLECFIAVSYSGMVRVPDGARAALQERVTQGSGVIASPGELLGDPDATDQLNLGEFKRI
jgi:hypothetical protein